MSQSTIRGIAPNQIVAGPDLVFSRDSTGLVTATQTYRVRRGDFYGGILQAKFRKGEPIGAIYPQVPAVISFLQIDTAELREQPGGIDEVYVSFVGYWQIESQFEERETTYTINSALEEKSILLFPKYLEEVTNLRDKRAITKGFDGTAKKGFKSTANNYYIIGVVADEPIWEMTSAEGRKWWDFIVEDGVRSFQSPVCEFTMSKSNAGGLPDSQVANLGKLDSPPGNPISVPGKRWFKSGATETRTLGSGASWSVTWTMIDDTPINNTIYAEDE